MFHVHVHIIPRFSQESPEGKTFPDRKKLGKTEMEEVGRKIRSKVQGDRRVWLTIFLVPGDIFRKKERGFFFYTICSSEERILQGQEKSGRSESIGKVSFTS